MIVQHYDKRCQFCSFWTRGKLDMDRENAFRLRMPSEQYGGCSNPKFVYPQNGSEPLPDGLTYADGEGCYAMFHTGEDFGCIHWTPNKDQDHLSANAPIPHPLYNER